MKSDYLKAIGVKRQNNSMSSSSGFEEEQKTDPMQMIKREWFENISSSDDANFDPVSQSSEDEAPQITYNMFHKHKDILN